MYHRLYGRRCPFEENGKHRHDQSPQLQLEVGRGQQIPESNVDVAIGKLSDEDALHANDITHMLAKVMLLKPRTRVLCFGNNAPHRRLAFQRQTV